MDNNVLIDPRLVTFITGQRRGQSKAASAHNIAHDAPKITQFDLIHFPSHDIIRLPFLDSKFCDDLVQESEVAKAFSVQQSDGRFGAPEIQVRTISPTLEFELIDAVVRFLSPIMWRHWTFLPTSFAPPFIIRYDAISAPSIPVHHDFPSDISISIALNDTFEGGGIFFPRQGVTLKKERVGTALLFPGKVTHPHGSLPVQQGERYVLTIWSKRVEKSNAKSAI